MNTYLKSLSTVLVCVVLLYLLALILGGTFHSLMISFVGAYFLFPLIKKCERWKIPRSLIIALMTLGLSSILLFVVFFILPLIVEQLVTFISSFPEYLKILLHKIIVIGDSINLDLKPTLEKYMEHETIMDWIKNHMSDISKHLLIPFLKISKSGLSGVLTILQTLINLFIIPIFFFFLVGSYEKITTAIADLFPPKQREIMKQYVYHIDEILNGYFRGQLTISIAIATYYSLMLSLVGVKFALLIGLCTGVLIIIPYVGLFASASLTIISVLTYSTSVEIDLTYLLFIYLGETMIEAPFIYPRLVGKKVGLGTLETILALAGGLNLGGVIGGLVGIPVAASFKYMIKDAITRYKESSYYR